MEHGLIQKALRPGAPVPNLEAYDEARARFSWDGARSELAGLPGGAINIAHEAVGRHAVGGRANQLALRWLAKTGAVQDFSYAELDRLANRFANLLGSLSIAQGERVFVLAGRIPELYIAVLGALKHGCVVSPLFSAFGPEPIATRLTIGRGHGAGHHLQPLPQEVAAIRASLPVAEACSGGPATRWQPDLPADMLDLPGAAGAGVRPSFARFPHAQRIPPCCISPAARPAAQRGACTCTRP